MNIIDYNSIYDADIKDLLVELQIYIASIDKEKYNIVGDKYGDIEFEEVFKEITKNEGKMLLAVENGIALGLIVGIIIPKEDSYSFKFPKRGKITELIVSKKCRSKGIGQRLLNKMNAHFKTLGCKGILIEVFAYNEMGKKFYYKNQYNDRSIVVYKKI